MDLQTSGNRPIDSAQSIIGQQPGFVSRIDRITPQKHQRMTAANTVGRELARLECGSGSGDSGGLPFCPENSVQSRMIVSCMSPNSASRNCTPENRPTQNHCHESGILLTSREGRFGDQLRRSLSLTHDVCALVLIETHSGRPSNEAHSPRSTAHILFPVFEYRKGGPSWPRIRMQCARVAVAKS